MNSKQRNSLKYFKKTGLIKPKLTSLRRTEHGIVYEYPEKLTISFIMFSSAQRDKNIEPLFKDFYESLNAKQQEQIIITKL